MDPKTPDNKGAEFEEEVDGLFEMDDGEEEQEDEESE